MNIPIPNVGMRLNYGSSIGTVRFVGEVDGNKGIWIGVEWDDPKRGKHSGNKDGKQYFNCMIPNSCSFIRPSALICYGQTFLQALSSKYIESQVNQAADKVILGSSNNSIEVEAIGLNKIRDKLSRLENLREVSLDSELVAYADDPSEIRKTCPNIVELDLSRNLLTTWNDVSRVVEGLPQLQILSLNHTRLKPIGHPSSWAAFNGIKELRLNKTYITWSQVLQLLPSLPSLFRLELGCNMIQTLSPAGIDTPDLVVLNLEQNELADFANAMQSLSVFTRLERLILLDNPLEDIPRKPTDAWSTIDALPSWLPKLESLNAGASPFFKEISSRPLTIARIPTLTMLNSSQISSAERRDAELYYLSYISKQGLTADELRENFRYMELCEIHGRPDVSQKSTETLKKRLIEIQCFRSLGPPPGWIFQKQAPDIKISTLPSMTLKVFRLKLLKSLKLPPHHHLKLWLVLENDSIWQLAELDDLSRSLDWWGMNEDCKVVFDIMQ